VLLIVNDLTRFEIAHIIVHARTKAILVYIWHSEFKKMVIRCDITLAPYWMNNNLMASAYIAYVLLGKHIMQQHLKDRLDLYITDIISRSEAVSVACGHPGVKVKIKNFRSVA